MSEYTGPERRHQASTRIKQFEQDVEGITQRVIREKIPVDDLTLRHQNGFERHRLIETVRERILKLFPPEDERLKDYKKQYEIWGDIIKLQCPWKELKARLLAKNCYYLNLIKELSGEGVFWGVDDNDNPLYVDYGNEKEVDYISADKKDISNYNYYFSREAVKHFDGYWPINWPINPNQSGTFYKICRLVRVLKPDEDNLDKGFPKISKFHPIYPNPDEVSKIVAVMRSSAADKSKLVLLSKIKSERYVNARVAEMRQLPKFKKKESFEKYEFDKEGRKRMVIGGLMLSPVLYPYLKGKEGLTLEMGPFTNPLVTPDNPDFKNLNIVYLDNEKDIISFLRKKYKKTANYFRCDLNRLDEYQLNTQRKADFVIASQVLNYVDYRKFFKTVYNLMENGGLLFINNVPLYGIFNFFDPISVIPRNNMQTLGELMRTGFEIVEFHIISPTDTKCKIFPEQEDNRLLAVAKKIKKE